MKKFEVQISGEKYNTQTFGVEAEDIDAAQEYAESRLYDLANEAGLYDDAPDEDDFDDYEEYDSAITDYEDALGMNVLSIKEVQEFDGLEEL